MKLLLGSQRVGTVHQFVGPEPALEVSTQNTKRMTKHWINNQHTAIWQNLSSIQRQAQKLINSPWALVLLLKLDYCPLTAYNPQLLPGSLLDIRLRKHLYVMGLINSPIYRCAAVEETSAHVLCEHEALATLRHTYMSSFLFDPKDISSVSRGAIWNIDLDISLKGTKGLSKGLRATGSKGLEPISYSTLKCSEILKQHIKSN
jgi:hypothetical protein